MDYYDSDPRNPANCNEYEEIWDIECLSDSLDALNGVPGREDTFCLYRGEVTVTRDRYRVMWECPQCGNNVDEEMDLSE